MKKLIRMSLLLALFLGVSSVFLGCNNKPPAPEEPAFEEVDMPDPSEMGATGGDGAKP